MDMKPRDILAQTFDLCGAKPLLGVKVATQSSGKGGPNKAPPLVIVGLDYFHGNTGCRTCVIAYCKRLSNPEDARAQLTNITRARELTRKNIMILGGVDKFFLRLCQKQTGRKIANINVLDL